jgi:hypothetical protein
VDKDVSAAAGNLLKVRLLLVVELGFSSDDIDILEYNREASDPVNSSIKRPSIIFTGNALIGDVLKLVWSTDKFFAQLVGKLDCRDKVAYTETKTHRNIDRSAIVITLERRLRRGRE